jgi:hypothetical protein
VTLLNFLQASVHSRWIGNERYKDKDKKEATDISLPAKNRVVNRCHVEEVEGN